MVLEKLKIFLIGLLIIILSELSLRFVEKNFLNNILIFLIPLIMIIYLYLIFYFKLKFKKYKI